MADSHSNAGFRALLISPDPGMAAELARLLARELPNADTTLLPAYPDAAALLRFQSSARRSVCFLDVISDRESGFEVMRQIARSCPGLPVIALLRAGDPDLILQCLRQGATEFLVRPFTTDQLSGALEKAIRIPGQPAAAPVAAQGQVCAVVPAKGASGATTLASNLAFAFRRAADCKVLLADLDGLSGTLPFLLKLKCGYSYVDAVSNTTSLDPESWKSLVTHAGGVDVMLSPENPVDCFAAAADPTPLLDYSRQAYDWIVADTSGAFGDWNLSLTKASDTVLLVTTNDLPALHAAQRSLAYLDRNGLERERVRVVLNRFQKNVGLQREDVETALRAELFEVLPSDPEAVLKALMEGKGVAAGTSFGKSVAAMAGRLQPRPS